MAVDWTPHRFSGGRLILDVTNTVVLRGDPRGFDRFDDRSEIPRFCAAASVERRDELAGRPLAFGDEREAETLIDLRESADRVFRQAAVENSVPAPRLGDLIERCGRVLAGSDEPLKPGAGIAAAGAPLPLGIAMAVSALALLPRSSEQRVRICGHCGWLFLDTSRNRSRVWCDMAVCGNRQKARRHYRRQLQRQEP